MQNPRARCGRLCLRDTPAWPRRDATIRVSDRKRVKHRSLDCTFLQFSLHSLPGTATQHSQALAQHNSRRAQCSADTFGETSSKLEIDKAFHLARETRAVTVPPNFFHTGHAIRIDIFQAHHFFQTKAAVSAPQAARLDAAMRSLANAVARKHIIYHNGAGLNVTGQGFAAGLVARPYACGQAIFGIISQAHRFLVAVECHDWKHGTECFLAHDAHVVGHVTQHRWRIKILSQVRQSGTANQDPRPARDSIFHMRLYDSQLTLVNHRAHVDLAVDAWAYTQLLRFIRAGSQKNIVQVPMHVTALDG